MLKRFFGVLLGVRPAPPAPGQPSPEAHWREAPTKTSREEVAAGVVAEISYATGHHGFINVVGELSYQDTLRSLPRVFTVKLVPEPQNPYDSNAVAIMTEDERTIGYLARAVARSYQAKLLQQPRPVTCPAKLTGGEGGKTHLGVVLDFEDVREALGLPLVAASGGPMDYDAAAEYHRVNNATRQLVKKTRALEGTDLPTAVAQYRRALALIGECHTLATTRGLIAHGFLPNQTDAVALERLVLCLIKLARVHDAAREVDTFCETFPHAREMKLLATIRTRIEKAST